MPDADEEERDDDGAPRVAVKVIPEARLQHRDEEGREKERHGSEDGLRTLEGLAALGFEPEVNRPVPTRLRGHTTHAARMWIVRAEDGGTARHCTPLLLRVVCGALLRVAQRTVGQSEHRKVVRRRL